MKSTECKDLLYLIGKRPFCFNRTTVCKISDKSKKIINIINTIIDFVFKKIFIQLQHYSVYMNALRELRE